CVSSQMELADCLYEGKGVDKSVSEANRWYRKVFEWTQAQAENGEPGAQAHLGDFFLRGQAIGHDVAAAIKWYLKSAEKCRFEWVNEQLEAVYLEGKWPATEIWQAVEWFQRAADEGSPRSQYILGLMYQR